MKKTLAILLALFLLFSLFPAMQAETSEVSPQIRVLLRRLNLMDRLDMVLVGRCQVEGSGYAVFLPGGTEITCQIQDSQLYLYTGNMTMRCGSRLCFMPTDPNGGMKLSGGSSLYPGTLDVTVSASLLQAVLTLPVETYLRGVLPYEMGDGFPLEALKAQAVCARTYAMARLASQKDWDVVDTTNDQVYRGTGNSPLCDQAIAETAGIVGTRGGKLASCYYAASNGGQTVLPSRVWPGEDDSIYAVSDDPYDLANPDSIVRRAVLEKTSPDLAEPVRQILTDALTKDLKKQGFDVSPASLRIDAISQCRLSGHEKAPVRFVDTLHLTVSYSGRRPLSGVSSTPSLAGGTYGEDEDMLFFATSTPGPSPDADVLGPFEAAREPAELTLPLFPQLARALHLSISGSDNELITLTETESQYVLEARRYGHGVGMSQRGAQYMAEHEGWSFDRILKFYYPGMELRVAPSDLPARSTPDPFLARTPGPSATPTPRPTLMPVTESLKNMPDGARLASVEGIADDSSLNLRSEPSAASEILMRLYKHQQVIVLETCEDPAWVHVRTDSAEGFVMVSFLAFADGPAPSPAPSALP